MMNAKSLLITLCAVFAIGFLHAQPDAETLLKNADAAVKNYKQFSYTFHYTERFRDKGLVKGDMDMIEQGKSLKWENINR